MDIIKKIKEFVGIMENPLNIISDISRLKNKVKRNDEYIKEKQEISNQLNNELNGLEKKYYKETAKESYVSLADMIDILGEEVVEKVMNRIKHISRIKDDGNWVKAQVPCWMCEVGNHMNMCVNNEKCDRGLEKCIGTRMSVVQVKEDEQLKLL